MPDGDIIHKNLRKIFQKAYKQLCENIATPDECAHTLLKSLRGVLKNKSTLPISGAKGIAHILNEELIKAGHISALNYLQIHQEIYRLIQRQAGPPREKDLLSEAAQRCIHDIRYGKPFNIDQAATDILSEYLGGFYEAEFKGRIPLTDVHHEDISQSDLDSRIESMDAVLYPMLTSWAKKSLESDSFQKLILPSLKKSKPVDLNENLLGSAR